MKGQNKYWVGREKNDLSTKQKDLNSKIMVRAFLTIKKKHTEKVKQEVW